MSATDTYVLLRAFADELARCGMQAACTSPGSRSAPLVLSLAAEPRLRCYSHVDERCAAFFALGLAKASGLPVAVACTSGTAAAELLPAAIEAREARVPLMLLTADRPPELRDVGAGQAIDQLKLFGGAAKWFFEVDLPAADEARLRWMRALACRAFWTALQPRAGVVHLNFPLREPLVLDGGLPDDGTGRAGGAPYVARTATGTPPAARAGGHGGRTSGAAIGELGALLAGSRRGLVVAGRHERPGSLGGPAAAFAASVGWPLLADPMSGARRGDAAIAHYDALLRDSSFASSCAPDLVLRVGDLPVSKPLREWLASLRIPQVALDPEDAWQDPAAALTHSLRLDPAHALSRLASGDSPAAPAPAEPEWLQSWRSADERAAEAIVGVLGGGALSEPAVATELGVLLPAEATLFVASSMPVRDVETFWPVRADPPRVLCNRGASGIDGTVSSAFGAAAFAQAAARDGERGGPVVLLIGDVALAHDIGGLLAGGRLGLALTIVLLENAGGGIFDFLPVAGAAPADVFTEHIATPTGLDFAAACALYGLGHERPGDVPGFRGALERSLAAEGCTLIEVAGERAANVALHRSVWDAVTASLSR